MATEREIETETKAEAEINSVIRIVKTKAMHEVDAVLHAEPHTNTHTHTLTVCVNEFINLKGLAGPCSNPRARTLSRPELALSLLLLAGISAIE